MKKNDIYDKNLSITYEASIRYLVEKSNKRAWLIAFIFGIITIFAVVGVSLLTPLKTVVPYVIRVDNATGQIDIITSINENKEILTGNEALDKHFVNMYVKAREGYYFNILQQDYVKVQLYSAPDVAESYRAIYEGANNKVEILKNMFEIQVEIKSIVLGNSAGIKTATVRFNLNQIDKKMNSISKVTAKIATLTYDYSPETLTKEKERLENPLGFKVLNYRIDDEIIK